MGHNETEVTPSITGGRNAPVESTKRDNEACKNCGAGKYKCVYSPYDKG